MSEVRGRDERSYRTFEARGGGWDELPHALTSEAVGHSREEQLHARPRPGGPTPRPGSPGCVVQEGLEKLSHIEGQEGWQ